MRIAVLLLVHKNVQQITRLINRLNQTDIDFYIHVDFKSSIFDELSKKMQEYKNVYICEDRYDIQLFSYEMVEATLELIKFAQNKGNYKYFMLLSGQDYPIKHINIIKKELEVEYPKCFIDVTPSHKGNWVYNSFKRSNCFKKTRGKCNSLSKTISNFILRMLYKCLTVLPLKTISYLMPSPCKVCKKYDISMYGGSQWWILSDQALNEMKSFYKSLNNNARSALKRVGSPDETFFQTCLMNCKNRYGVNENPWNQVAQNNKTLSHFSSSGHPELLDSRNFQEIISSEKWFARKFDIDIDEVILDKLDFYIGE